MRNLLKYFKGFKKEAFIAPLFKMLEAIFELMIPLVVSDIIDNGIGNADKTRIFTAAGIMVILGIVGFVCAVTAQFFAAKAAVGFAKSLRSSLFAKIQSLSYSRSDSIGSATLITRMTGDVNTLQTGVNLFLRLFMRSPFIVFGAMIMAFTINTRLALTFTVTIPLLAVIVFGLMIVSISLFKKVQAGLDRLVGKTRSNYNGTRVIRAFNRENEEIKEFGEKNDRLTALQMFAGRISALMNPLTYVVVNIAIVLLIRFGGIKVDSGEITQGELIALYNYMSQILVELIKLANLIITLNKSAACAVRINSVFNTESTENPVPEREYSGSGEDVAVEFENVSFGYSKDGDRAVSDVSFSVKRGQTVGIIGGTGSGKSTLINLIPGFYYPTSGSVFINGKNTALWDSAELRSKVGIVPQRASLFRGSIRSNLEFGKENATDTELWSALEAAQAKDFVLSKEGGLDAVVEQGGRNLSGGQKQRLTIARALVAKTEILILDDSSSALDYATEARLRDAVASLDWNPTVFIVSQRASSIMAADLIIVCDDGNIVGTGTHEQLLGNCEVYREIYASQFGGEGA